MIELQNQNLVFTFPEIHPKARLEISFQRTLRIPDTDRAYPLPPGLGSFPLEHVDDCAESSRCFIHLLNSRAWSAVIGKNPPTIPPSARDYTKAGLPWYEYYTDDSTSLPASGVIGKLKSVFTLGKEKGQNPLPENQSTGPKKILEIKKSPNQVREW